MAAKVKSQWIVVPSDVSKGEWRGGDPALIPDGYARRLRNHVRKSGVWQARPQFTYDDLATIHGIADWHDETTGKRRLVAVTSAGKLSVKASSGETYAAAVGINASPRTVLDHFSYRGSAYLLTGDDSLDPLSGVWRYNGSTFAIVAVSNEGGSTAFEPRCGAMFKERAYYSGASLFVLNALAASSATQWKDASTWTATNVSVTSATSGGQTTCRITPTNTTSASIRTSLGVSASSGTDDPVATWSGYLRSTSSSYSVPMTAQLVYQVDWSSATAYVSGQVATPTTANDNYYRCTTAGTTAVGEPTWPTTVGSTVVDGTVTWTCMGSDVRASQSITLPTLTVSNDWQPFTVKAVLPSAEQGTVIPRLKFGNASSTTYTLTPVEFSFLDGRTDGDPLKRNYGHQLYAGSFALPFANNDSGTGDVSPEQRDTIFISDVASPAKVSGTIYYRFRDVPGDVTALKSAFGNLVAFKRQALAVFGSTADPYSPILPEGDTRPGYGCPNPKAAQVGPDGALYFIDTAGSEVYRWNGSGDPEPLCGDAMRDEMFNKSASSWVESQTAPANRALLTIWPEQRLVLCYTQKGKIYAYNLETEGWTVWSAGGSVSDATGYQICDMLYNPNTGNVYFAFTEAATGTAGLARIDYSQSGAEDQISSTGTLPVIADFQPRPIELMVPGRYELMLEYFRLFHKITGTQGSQTITPYWSKDHGTNWTALTAITLPALSTGEYRPLRIPFVKSWGTLALRVVHSGKGGAADWTFSRAETDVKVLAGEYYKASV